MSRRKRFAGVSPTRALHYLDIWPERSITAYGLQQKSRATFANAVSFCSRLSLSDKFPTLRWGENTARGSDRWQTCKQSTTRQQTVGKYRTKPRERERTCGKHRAGNIWRDIFLNFWQEEWIKIWHMPKRFSAQSLSHARRRLWEYHDVFKRVC